jgi:CDP-diacylglycerol pyrophosphatase
MTTHISCYTLQVKSQVKSIHKQQTTIWKPIECAPEASLGGSMEMAEGDQ